MRHDNIERETTDMTQLLEIINAKGDEGELGDIVDSSRPHHSLVCNEELFWKELRTIAEDSAREGG
ncbi:hypothetical protein [Anoxybacteroides tepidamans]|uniref:hypothetical protein n=1 Tax=Anoxybacteroides tepidamans TaxID=265948 RepID=UPI000487EB94|nr:hypothetical protein [Anoxybacillus tepidamans]